MKENLIEILLTRENSSMASTWDELLGIYSDEHGCWNLGTCMNEIIGSVDDLEDTEKFYDDSGDLVIPSEINGKKVLGIVDGYYFIGEGIEFGDPAIVFDKQSIGSAIAFLEQESWDLHPDYQKALKQINAMIGD